MTKPIRNDRCEAWYDGSAVCVIAVGSHGDPLDLAEHEVEALIDKLQVSLKQVRMESANTHLPKPTSQEQGLGEAAKQIHELIVGKTLARVLQPRSNEVALEFSDGARLFIDAKSALEFSIT